MTGTSRWWATESVLLRNGWKRNMACSEIKNGVFVSVFLSPRAYPLTKFLFLRSFVEGVLSHSQLIRSATDFPTWPFLVICIVRRYPHPSYGIFLYEMPYHADFWYNTYFLIGFDFESEVVRSLEELPFISNVYSNCLSILWIWFQYECQWLCWFSEVIFFVL